jgi:diguanylate cyclase (GGDEF)-like protein/PAS domain S-box-containing protein
MTPLAVARLDAGSAELDTATIAPAGGPIGDMLHALDAAFAGPDAGALSSPQLLRETLENIAQGVIMFDRAHRIRIWNKRALDLLGLPVDFVQQHPTIDEIITYQTAQGEFTELAAVGIRNLRRADLERRTTVFERTRPNGTILKIATTPLSMGGFVRTFTDVTESRKQQAALISAEREFRTLYDNATIGIYRATIDGMIRWANPALVRLNGFETEAELIESVVENANEWYIDPGRGKLFFDTVMTHGRIEEFESEVRIDQTGERIWISENAWLVRDDAGNPIYFEGTIFDITARKRSEYRAAFLTSNDELTGLLNRSAFLAAADVSLAAHCSGKLCAMLSIDLDGFKAVNDRLSGQGGDRVLRTIARRIVSALPDGCVIARSGGDEFSVLMHELADLGEVGAAVSTLVDTIAQPVRVDGEALIIGASIGVATTADANTAADLMRAADAALMSAKQAGKFTYRVFRPERDTESLRRLQLETDLRSAIQNDEFFVVYQPIVEAANGRVVSREALLRWRHPVFGLVSPGEFIPIATRIGFMVPIEQFVLERVCRETVRFADGLPIAVNVSACAFSTGSFCDTFRRILSKTGCAPEQIEIEITENVLISDDANTLKVMEMLRAMGAKISLDDFGAGYSSLSYLQRFAFDKIKIDQSLLRNGQRGKLETAILRSVLALGKEIGVPVVVEGIETEMDRAYVLSNGCVYAQGYLYGRPREPAA